MDDPNSSAPRPSLVDQAIAAAGIPDEHDAVLVTLKSDLHSRHSVGVAVRVADQWTLGAAFEKEAARGKSLTVTSSWKRR